MKKLRLRPEDAISMQLIVWNVGRHRNFSDKGFHFAISTQLDMLNFGMQFTGCVKSSLGSENVKKN